MEHTCDLRENGRCKKYRQKRRICEPSTHEWLDTVEWHEGYFIHANEMCRMSSIFGNTYIGLTQNDIDRLKNGEILHITDEYGLFVGFIKEE